MRADDAEDVRPQPAAPGLGADHHALFAGLYAELHRLARREVHRQGPSSPVSATTLLHEAYLDISRRHALDFPNQAQFLAYAGRAMRGLVIDRVRERQSIKRGGGLDFTVFDTQVAEDCEQPEQLTALGDALDELALLEPELANVVDLRYFCGLTMAEIAELQGVSERSVQRRWEKARLLLFRAMGGVPNA
jgi:RNA polymerase sigma factor (TIGR02999 family)